MTDNLIEARVHAMRFEAKNIISLELRDPLGRKLPEFTPGAHIDLHLQKGMVRSYSLINTPLEKHRYLVAVLNEGEGRGGSRFIHQTLRVGEVLRCTRPRNTFPLNEEAPKTVLIAGGIGITPIICMYERLLAIGKPVDLIYCARSHSAAAFLDRLALCDAAKIHFDDENGGPVDLRALMVEKPREAHFYCCGPEPMILAFQAACSDLGIPNVHLERFAPAAGAPAIRNLEYKVHLAKKGLTIDVPAGKSLIEALEEAGIEVDFSCREGICGVCETKVLEGIPEHRDSVLTERERATGRKMMVCVSGCQGTSLTLDL